MTTKRLCLLALVLALGVHVAAAAGPRPPITPKWVFGLWLWEDDVHTDREIREIVHGFLERDIPVSAIIIDAPWSTEFNNFEFDPEQYPDPQGLIDEMHAKGIRVTLWVTGIMNEYTRASGGTEVSELYLEGLEKGYFCNDGRPIKWWRGHGAHIDYTNPEAVEWWRGLMDKALDMGIDGWKVDGVAILFPSEGHCASGPISTREYMDLYYSDFHDYTVSRNPDAVALVRSVDNKYIQPGGFAPIDKANATWVGDQKHQWGRFGFLEALDNIFHAMRLGYAVVGADGGGYQPGEQTENRMMDKNLLLRWMQFSAFITYYQFGGHNERRIWLYGDEVVDIFRHFTMIHHALIPYMYSLTARAHHEGGKVMTPQPGRWQFTLGDDIFVSVIYEDTTTRKVSFPEGSTWIDFWNDAEYEGGSVVEDYYAPLNRYPAFIRKGAIIPMEPLNDEIRQGTMEPEPAGFLTLDMYPDPEADSAFTVYNEDGPPTEVRAMMRGKIFIAEVDDAAWDLIFRVRLDMAPKTVMINGEELRRISDLNTLAHMEGGWTVDRGRLWIKVKRRGPVRVTVGC